MWMKKMSFVLACFLAVAFLFGCAAVERPGLDNVIYEQVLVAGDLLPTGGGRDLQAAIVANGANDFAFRLSAEILRSNASDNFVLSPYSVWLP